MMERIYICIDLKSYYASVECVYRHLDPLQTNLLVADESRSDQTICLAVSPSLKAIGVPGRPRLFEAKQKIRQYEWEHHCKIDYIIATPRMAEYERISAQIYAIYLRYVAEEDIHVYSIDECFIDVTPYLHLYCEKAKDMQMNSAHYMALTMIRNVLAETGITATAGIGTNLYLAKVAMDIVAKKRKADKDGVRIAELNEDSYKFLLWDHQPLTDFWQIGLGISTRLNHHGLYTMGDIAALSQFDEEWFYKEFGVNAEIIIDHAWGIEPVTMKDIKAFKPSANSLSLGQVLPRAYNYTDARLVFREMTDDLAINMASKNITSRCFSFWISYDHISLERVPSYKGPVVMDYYGRLHPKHTVGTVRFRNRTSHSGYIATALLNLFDQKVDHRLYIRKMGICADDTVKGTGIFQLDFFTDYEELEKNRNMQKAILAIRKKYGTNAVLKGMNLMKNATAKERNEQIGGHKA
ncbi:MAG: DNA methylase [Solobacterium sp.]|nr:DNA methylase [Solobacterium sp.]